ncbi:U3 small nucleolar RNA-associated protein 15 homolog [Anthonomus grandis grandis]|uniref:U3 small nucleolar RNA-associated protein 15 homolog n=1 Tax=Anthonomus grandis grandis TaxID=2921223 RepID=UPI002164F2D8|nr:U3 small nucleolar RNA-associated protein 15 homolog [Anthonomus grandis grandis]
MSNFKRLNTKIYEKKGPEITPDFVYWKQLGKPVLVKEFGPVDYIDFSPKEPHYFAVTCSVRVQLYNPITKLVVKNLSRFRENAYGAVFRSDGTLILAGGEEKNVKLFDVSTKSMLRLFKGHTAPVHRVGFIPKEPQIVSFSDDKSVRVWDIPTENILNTFEGHNDYIRAGVVNPDVPNIILSGGYDGMVKMWDTRTNKEVMKMNHTSAVESLLYMPGGGMVLSAGGTDIKIWDVIAGGKLRGAIAQHHKTVTCLRLASNGKRLLSGSLDRHVKIYDVGTFKVVHTLDFPNGILSLGVSPDDSTLTAGLVDGVIAVQRRPDQIETEVKPKTAFQHKSREIPVGVDEIVPSLEHESEAKFDYFLRKFEYSKALNSALKPIIVNKHPEKTVAVLRELQKRKALPKTLKEKDLKTIKNVIKFFLKYLTDLRFTKFLTDVADEFLDIIAEDVEDFPKDVGLLLVQLHESLVKEEKLINDLAQVEGMMQTLLAAQVSSHFDQCLPIKVKQTNECTALNVK